MDTSLLGKWLMGLGGLLALLGGLLWAGARWGGPRIGRLPGDIVIHRGHFSLYVPLATSLLLSLVLTLILRLVGRH